MIKKFIYVLLAFAFSCMIGCSGFDRNRVLVHPVQTTPSAVFDVALLDIYTYINSGTTLQSQIKRDSLHLLVGLPQSWNVVSASVAVVNSLNTAQLFKLQDNKLEASIVAGLLLEYQNKAVNLPVDALLPAKIQGDTLKAHGQSSDEKIDILANKIKMWKGFSAPVNIVFEAGSKPDSLFPTDSVLKTSGVLEDESMAQNIAAYDAFIPDSAGISMVPVAVFLKIQAGPQEQKDTLYYFSKTGTMTPEKSQLIPFIQSYPELVSKLSDIESGDMTYIPVLVSSSAGVILANSTTLQSKLTAVAGRCGTVRIELGSLDRMQAHVSIYSLQGMLVASLAANGSNAIVWNGNDKSGNRVPSGSYLVQAGDRRQTVSLCVNIAR